MIGRICQEFTCTPLEALRQPLPLCLEIMEARAFADAWHTYTTAKEKRGVTVTPMIQAVKDMLAERNAERLRAQGRLGPAGPTGPLSQGMHMVGGGP